MLDTEERNTCIGGHGGLFKNQEEWMILKIVKMYNK